MEIKFILTEELGRLSRWLRILGYDAVVEKDRKTVVIKSLRDDRIILTRDSKMSRFSGVRIIRVGSDFVEEQLAQLIKELSLEVEKNRLFSLCVACDEPLVHIKKDMVIDKVPKHVYDSQKIFMECPKCGKIYWQGSHWELVGKFLNKIKD